MLRSHAVRAVLAGNDLPINFHGAALLLAQRVLLLLRPVTDHFYALPSPAREPMPSMLTHQQDMYNIISHAGYLAVCVRLSSSIFHHQFPLTGNTHIDNRNQFNLSPNETANSRNLKLDQRNDRVTANFATIEGLRHQLNQLHEKHAPVENILECQGDLDSMLTRQACESVDLTETHRPKIKISVWPLIQRLRPGNREVGTNDFNDLEIYLVCAAGIVCNWMRRGRWIEGEGSSGFEERNRGVPCVKWWQQTFRYQETVDALAPAGKHEGHETSPVLTSTRHDLFSGLFFATFFIFVLWALSSSRLVMPMEVLGQIFLLAVKQGMELFH